MVNLGGRDQNQVQINSGPRSLFNRPPNFGIGQPVAQASGGTFILPSGSNRAQLQPSAQRRHNIVQEVKANKDLIKQLMDMGFSKSMCKAALKRHNNNLEKSLDKLLENCERYIGVENSEDSDENEQQWQFEEHSSEQNHRSSNSIQNPGGIVPGIIQPRNRN